MTYLSPVIAASLSVGILYGLVLVPGSPKLRGVGPLFVVLIANAGLGAITAAAGAFALHPAAARRWRYAAFASIAAVPIYLLTLSATAAIHVLLFELAGH